MKRGLSSFYKITILSVFVLSFIFTSLFYIIIKEKNFRNFFEIHIENSLNNYVSRELGLKTNIIENAIINAKNLNDIVRIKELSESDFAFIVDNNGTVIKNFAGLIGYSIKDEYLFNLALNSKTKVSTLTFLAPEILNRGLINFKVQEKELVFAYIYPFQEGNIKKYLIMGYLIGDGNRKIFSEKIEIADVACLLFQDGRKINLYGPHLEDKLVKRVNMSESTIFNTEEGKYVFRKVNLVDLRGQSLAKIIAGKRIGNYWDYITKEGLLLTILYSILFAGLIGILFYRHLKKERIFLKDLSNILSNFINGKFEVIKQNVDSKEFEEIYDKLNDASTKLSNHIKGLYDEISLRAKEIFEINKALIILNRSGDLEDLIDKAENFLKEELELKVIDIDECNKRLNECSECGLRPLIARIGVKEYGFCVELDEDKEGYKTDFLDIFEEVFTTNIYRISNSLKISETYKESLFLSEILITLMQKRNINEIFSLILNKAMEICKGDAAYIGVYDKNEEIISLKFFSNVKTDEFKNLKFSKNLGLGGLVLREKRGMFIENYFADPRIESPFVDVVKKEGIISTIAVPIFHGEEIFGILYVGYRSIKKGITFELSLLEKMANAAAIALDKENYITELKTKESELRTAYNELVEKRREINELLKGYREANIELERSNRELTDQYEIVKKSYEELNSLNKAKDLFLGILSHELKTPITIIKGYIETLLSRDFELTEKVKNTLVATMESVNSLSQKVDDLLDYMRLETKKLKLNITEISLKGIFEDIIKELQPFIEERKQNIELFQESDIQIKVDPKWFKKALMSILSNSIKFTPDGGTIHLDFSVVDRKELSLPDYVKEAPKEASRYILISVRDEGIGVPKGELNKIFDSFYELGDIKTHSTGKYKFMAKGVGLGLSFVKQIIQLHNGIVYAESDGFDIEKCPGTTVFICLPMEEERERAEEGKESIVIIDSNYEFSRFLELFLSQKYSVHLFEDGGVGYLKVLEIKPRLVMINVSLNMYDGYEVCSVIKEDKRIKDIPVILYGSGPESFDEIRASKVKANMIFYPIFDTENLMRVIEYYMKR